MTELRRRHPDETTNSDCYDRMLDRTRTVVGSEVPLETSVDALLTAILVSPRREAESYVDTFRRKERELLHALGGRTAVESLALQRRLTTPRSGDVLAAEFSKLVVERRNRILLYLAECRRRR